MQKEAVAGFRLSQQQEHLWTVQPSQQHDLDRARCAVIVAGPLNVEALQATIATIVARHEILRTTFQCLPGMVIPLQVVAESGAELSHVVDRHAVDGQELDAQIDALWNELAEEAAGVTDALDVRLVRLAGDRHVLLLSLPALCADESTFDNLVREISQGYRATIQGQEFADEALQYIDLADWQRDLIETAANDAPIKYWRNHNLSTLLSTKLVFQEQADNQGFVPQQHPIMLDPETLPQIEALAQQSGTSVEAIILACWQTLLWHYTGQTEYVIGVAADIRKQYDELEGVLGPLVTYVPLHCRLNPDLRFSELVTHVAAARQELATWQSYFSWQQISQTFQLDAAQSYVPICFSYTEQTRSYTANDLELQIAREHVSSERFVVQLRAQRAATGLQLQLHADRTRLPRAALPVLADALHTLLRHALAAPATPLAALPLLSSAAAARLVVQRNRTARPLPEPSLLAAFAAQVVRTPAAPALHSQGQTRSFAQLETAANQLAHHLQAHGVGPDTLVALALPRTPTLVVALLAVLKAGGAYLPLDSSAPAARTAAVLAQAQVALVLTDAPHAAELPPVSVPVLQLDQPNPAWSTAPTSAPASTPQPEQLAYVLFTSGSTGQPKGVAVTHGGLLNYLAWARTTYLTPDGQGAPVHSPLSFDLTVTSLLVPLLGGQAVTLLDEEQPLEALAGALQPTAAYSLVKLTPAHLALLDATLPQGSLAGSTQALVIGGEALQGSAVRRWQREAPATRLINEYGPTETVVGCCVYEAPAGAAFSGAVPIGRPIANMQVYVLNALGQPVPVGVTGELYIGGAQVARGYLGQPAQTAERFLPDPFGQQPGARLYRTGDLARYNLDEDLEYLGRTDRQIKLRGFRIELDEIEAALAKHPAVRESIVLVRDDMSSTDEHSDQRLVAYVVTDSRDSSGEIQTFLKERLPEYMVPAVIVALNAFPLTPNGKIDQQALRMISAVSAEPVTEPRTAVEAVLAQVWSELLGQTQSDVHTSFFEVGGHSLLAIQLMARLQTLFHVQLSLYTFFDAPTIAELAQMLIDSESKPGQMEKIARAQQKLMKMSPEDKAAMLQSLKQREV